MPGRLHDEVVPGLFVQADRRCAGDFDQDRGKAYLQGAARNPRVHAPAVSTHRQGVRPAMNGIHQLPDAERVRQEASDWIARLHSDDATAQDKERFEAWRMKHPHNARAYDELMSTWQRFA